MIYDRAIIRNQRRQGNALLRTAEERSLLNGSNAEVLSPPFGEIRIVFSLR